MGIENISVRGYSMEYPTMNLELLKTDEKSFDMCLIVVHLEEARKGFKVKKIGKTTRKGTKVTYAAIESKEDLDKCKKKISNLIDQYNKKYGTKYTLN